MENLHIKGDQKSPTMIFNTDGVIEIKGRSWPEHAVNAYQPAFDWIDEYSKAPQAKTLVKVALEYFNTSSSKVVLEIMRKIEALSASGNDVKIEWYYEEDDYDLEDMGETFKEMVKVPIELIAIPEFDFTFED